MTAFFATCPRGLEYLLRDELTVLHAQDVHEALAGVHFSGTQETALRACLWSRLASRVLMPLATFDAADAEALYDGVAAIDWSEHLADDATLAVDATCSHSHLTHSRFVALKVKDAVVDQCRRRSGQRPDIDVEQPDLRLNLHLKRNRATLSLDLSGSPLHRRGWRSGQGTAPLKENLAAAILMRAQWPAIYADGGALLDPMCGGATLVVEAALMAADVAPGLRRDYFGFSGWRGHDAPAWQALVDEAQARADTGLRALRACFIGSDSDPKALAIARANAQQAGVAGFVQLQRHDLAHVVSPPDASTGLVVTNPPYGERLGERAELPALYTSLGEVLRSQFSGWHAAVLAGDADLGRAMGLRASKRYQLFNGALETPLLVFEHIAPRKAIDDVPAKPLSAGAQMLKNRLQKNLRHLRKRLRRDGVTCYRAYDRDLPEYAVAIDVFESWLHVQEYRAPDDVPEHLARDRLREAVRVAGDVLEIPRERIALKQRRRGKGGSRYGHMDSRGEFVRVQEGGLAFLVNLTDYLDTGLFLDHRLVRQQLRDLARGRRFLNLFAYTGTASVYAAAGGASDTTSVDLSATYLDWASRNLAANGFSGSGHRLMQGDAMTFLREDAAHYGLIYVDPPTFSNSKRAEDFDVQRDHVALLEACGKRLRKDGVIVFSNNFRRFQLNRSALESRFDIEDHSAASIPFDFARHADIHGCWLLRLR